MRRALCGEPQFHFHLRVTILRNHGCEGAYENCLVAPTGAGAGCPHIFAQQVVADIFSDALQHIFYKQHLLSIALAQPPAHAIIGWVCCAADSLCFSHLTQPFSTKEYLNIIEYSYNSRIFDRKYCLMSNISNLRFMPDAF